MNNLALFIITMLVVAGMMLMSVDKEDFANFTTVFQIDKRVDFQAYTEGK